MHASAGTQSDAFYLAWTELLSGYGYKSQILERSSLVGDRFIQILTHKAGKQSLGVSLHSLC